MLFFLPKDTNMLLGEGQKLAFPSDKDEQESVYFIAKWLI